MGFLKGFFDSASSLVKFAIMIILLFTIWILLSNTVFPFVLCGLKTSVFNLLEMSKIFFDVYMKYTFLVVRFLIGFSILFGFYKLITFTISKAVGSSGTQD